MGVGGPPPTHQRPRCLCREGWPLSLARLEGQLTPQGQLSGVIGLNTRSFKKLTLPFVLGGNVEGNLHPS